MTENFFHIVIGAVSGLLAMAQDSFHIAIGVVTGVLSMAQNSLHIVIGAVSGVLTAFVLLAVRKLWLHTVLPLWKRWRYRGPHISGGWKGLGTGHTPASGEWSEVALALKQNALDLHGLMTIRHRSAVHSFDLDLQVAGTISEGFVTLSLSSRSDNITSVATALLKIDGGGAALNGQLLYRNAFVDTVDVINMSVHRADSIAAPRLHTVHRTVPVIRAAQTSTPLAAAAAVSE